MKPHAPETIAGSLVTLPLPGPKPRTLDGFWVKGPRRAARLLVFVHGMGSNFYKSRFKKAWMRLGPRTGMDVFSFNNRGCEGAVTDERFSDCVADIDAALAFARTCGYREIVLLGHSTGCQKIVWHWTRRRPPEVSALILAAVGDDHAIARRDLGPRFQYWLARARTLVAEGRGDTRLPPACLGFTARRFLSAVDPHAPEANLFRLEGPLTQFRKVTIPVFALFPAEEQYACIPVEEAADRLRAVTRSTRFGTSVIPRADHSFHGEEESAVRATLRWLNTKN
jgi:pimeloyl-ACP methyl ester carboxylesterase